MHYCPNFAASIEKGFDRKKAKCKFIFFKIIKEEGYSKIVLCEGKHTRFVLSCVISDCFLEFV